jgi:hypothetical protein
VAPLPVDSWIKPAPGHHRLSCFDSFNSADFQNFRILDLDIAECIPSFSKLKKSFKNNQLNNSRNILSLPTHAPAARKKPENCTGCAHRN